jgi:hypothetical protein
MSPLYKKFNNCDENGLNCALMMSCRFGNLDEVRYLLTSPELQIHADAEKFIDSGLELACSGGHLELIKYLLFSPELKKNANLHAYEHDYIHTPFVNALSANQLKIIEYFIFELNIERKPYIDEYFKYSPNPQIENLFILRDLNNSMPINEITLENKRLKL